MKKIVYVLFIILVFIACSKEDDKIVLNFWAMGVEGEVVSKLMPEFEKRNPGVKVVVQQLPWLAAHEKLITAFASETLPDVFQLGNTWVPEFEALSSIEPLNSYISSSSVVSDSNYFSGIWDTNIIDTTVFAIPWYVDTRVLFYRTDILKKAGFNEPPKTWDELYKICLSIKENSKGEHRYSFFIPLNEWVPFVVFAIQNGSTLLRDNDRYGNVTGKKFKEAFKFLMKFYDEGLAPVDMQQVLNVYQGFGDGFFAFYITGPWNVTEMKKRLPENVKYSWMTAPLPAPDKNYPGYSLAGGSSLVINNNSANKNYAWKLIEYLSEEKTQLEFYNLVSSLPAVKNVWLDSAFVNNPYMKAFYLQLQKTKATPKIPEWEQIAFSKIMQYAEQAARKLMTADEALKKLDNDINNILRKRRWMIEKKNEK